MLACPVKTNSGWKTMQRHLPNKAYTYWAYNNGNPLDLLPDGKASPLYYRMLKQHGGNEGVAFRTTGNYYSKTYRDLNGDWVKAYMANVKGTMSKQDIINEYNIRPGTVDAKFVPTAGGIQTHQKQGSKNVENAKVINQKASEAALEQDIIDNFTDYLPQFDYYSLEQKREIARLIVSDQLPIICQG